MKLTVAGRDRSGDLGAAIAEEAGRLKASVAVGTLSPEHSALRLKQAANLEEYITSYMELLRIRHGVQTTDYYIPRRAGIRGKVSSTVKKYLWKLLRYQYERIMFQQNLINELEINSAEFQRDRIKEELAELRHRIASLERGRAPEDAP